jgi:hypothetical protein
MGIEEELPFSSKLTALASDDQNKTETNLKSGESENKQNPRKDSFSSSSSCSDKMETASSDERNSDGSEFGGYANTRDLKKKLPQIKRDMAKILNIKVIIAWN